MNLPIVGLGGYIPVERSKAWDLSFIMRPSGKRDAAVAANAAIREKGISSCSYIPKICIKIAPNSDNHIQKQRQVRLNLTEKRKILAIAKRIFFSFSEAKEFPLGKLKLFSGNHSCSRNFQFSY